MRLKVSVSLIAISLIIILASVRGALVYHLGFPASITYALTAVMLMGFGVLSFFNLHNSNPTGELVFLKNAVKLNMLFGLFFIIANIFLYQQLDVGIMYSFFIYPVIFVLIKLDRQWLDGLVYFVAAVTALGVILFLNLAVTGGFEALEAANLTVRPGELSYSRIGRNYLPAGYQGDHHDAANILIMCDVLFLSKFILCERRSLKYLYLALYLLVFMVVITTGSSANIIILIAVSGLAFGFLAKKNTYLFIIYLGIGFLFSLLTMDSISDYFYFIDHINQSHSSEAGFGGMFFALDFDSFLLSIPSMLFGFGTFFDSPMRYSEIAFLKMLIGYGILPFLIQMFILFSPVYYWLVIRKNYKNI